MAKKIKFESFIYRFLIAAEDMRFSPQIDGQISWQDFIRGLKFNYSKGEVDIIWQFPESGNMSLSLREYKYYLRGDSLKDVERQNKSGLLDAEDLIKQKNGSLVDDVVKSIAESAGYKIMNESQTTHDERIQNERDFHDAWANSEDVNKIDVKSSNEVCTAPEMRYITKRIGDFKNKSLLDVGCGLGEASVYFAMLGADVTSSDLSQGMLDATSRLAQANGVKVKEHIASAEDMRLPADARFDIIYTGNLLHHVNIDETISRVKPHLTNDGVFVSWDPLAYNPAINVYRSMATDVRTPDEHPLKWGDIKIFKKHFENVETKYYWFTTLIIFVIMALAQRRNPNKERFWKVVVQEGGKWEWLYKPLEKVDSVLLTLFPPLRLLCWNVVIVASKPRLDNVD